MAGRRVACLAALAACFVFSLPAQRAYAAANAGVGVGNVPQGTQSDAAFAASYAASGVTSVDATSQRVSCYRPEVPYFTVGTAEGYDGMTACPGATTGENTGASSPYPTQVGSNPGYPASGPMLVKDHSESDIRVDTTNPRHLIGTSKWFVGSEGYNHQLGFYESFDGGATWPVQGHIPGYEGWTDNTDPVGAFDPWGNFYSLNLPYQFFYDADGGHDYRVNPALEPNPAVIAEVVSVSVRPHGAHAASDWIVTHDGRKDVIKHYDRPLKAPDKQWLTIDDNPRSPHYGRVYAMWAVFYGATPLPFVSFADAHPDGTHTDWSTPQLLPQGSTASLGNTFLLPHVASDGTVYTTESAFSSCCAIIQLISSSDGGASWAGPYPVASGIVPPGLTYAHTSFRDGIENSFTVGPEKVGGHYPLYSSWEDNSTGIVNVILSASYDGGRKWSAPIQVNDNRHPVDEFQPNLATSEDGVVSVAFYDRRLDCPNQGTREAANAGLALDTANPATKRPLPPFGAHNYCVNSAIQFYSRALKPLGHNIRLSAHTWDPELNAPNPYGISAGIGFIGDYFGNVANGSVEVTTSVSTFNDGSNPAYRQQQIVAQVVIP